MDIREDSPARPAVHPESVDTRLYVWVLENRSTDVGAAAAALGLTVEQVEASLRRLVALRLVFSAADEPGAGHAVAPETAMAELAAPVEARIREERRQLAEAQAQLIDFHPHYQQLFRFGGTESGV